MKGVYLPQAWADPLVQPKQWKRDIRFGTCNVRSLCRSGSLMTVARELARSTLDVVGVQEVMWDRWGTVRAGDYRFFCAKGNENQQLGTRFFCVPQNSIIS